ncbi:hypothetical protein REBECCA_280 [Erwinia phage Rebecca]|uniref:Uncharacterized protein n=3 Tax=Agricanvirus TaxID=1984776 RepID=A0A173GDH2_9CAUD|nr:hypothetical protein FDH99_gp243 [Erwinia phage vB_EamM_Simmy50]ANH51741.1 hypothetical protein SIMMY50_283 [Erwinia phage vB_EamM_Simmy50]AUG86067.1 hypothetical protein BOSOLAPHORUS_281 [Erwinia phage vB_EamM_Bosolaphorus]QBP07385.1 hypothetical protein REBECCA_280 [Erwinia phage Rebecca]
MLHENFEALVANIANQINQLEPEDLPSLILTKSGVYINDKRHDRTRLLLNLFTPQPGHTHDVTFDQELQDAFAHNNLEFIKVGEGIAYGLLRTSIVNNEPAVFWIHADVSDDASLLKQAWDIITDLKKNAGYPQAFNIDVLDVSWHALSWAQLLGTLLDRTDPTRRFRLATNADYDFVLSQKAITYYQETLSKRPMAPVAYLDDTNLFNGGDFNDSDRNWAIAPNDSTRPIVKVYV